MLKKQNPPLASDIGVLVYSTDSWRYPCCRRQTGPASCALSRCGFVTAVPL